ncbi:MAG: site-specific integrase [Clostridiales bacterium]|nr:site-specific integrase [Candidatus Blautia equi]
MAIQKGYSIVKRGETYRVSVYIGKDSDGKQIKKTTTFKPDPKLSAKKNELALEKFAIDFEKKAKNGLLFDGDKMSFSDFCKKWENEYAIYNLEETTLSGYKGILERTILPEIGHLKIGKITPLHLVAFYNDLIKKGYDRNGIHKEYSFSSLQRYHAIISTVMKTAVQWQIIDSNPCLKCKPPKDNKNVESDVKYFTLEEAERFLEALGKSYTATYKAHDRIDDTGKKYHVEAYTEERTIPLQLQVFFNLALFGGLRRGENIALTWSDIDFTNNTVTINKSTANLDGKQITKAPKNKSSNRIITLPTTVMHLLKRHKLDQRNYRLSIGDQWERDENGDPCDYLFTQWNGSQMNLSTPYHAFRDILDKYNNAIEDPEDRLPVIPLHGLRHTSATLLISQNIDVRTVSGRLGHAQTSTTMNIYAHSLKKLDEKASNTLEDLFTKRA